MSRESMEQHVSARISSRSSTRSCKKPESKLEESAALEIGNLQGQLTEAKDKIVQAQKSELQLRKDRRDLEERQQELELTVTRTLDSERATIREHGEAGGTRTASSTRSR